MSLHKLWDSTILVLNGLSAPELAARLLSDRKAIRQAFDRTDAVSGDDAADWAIESRDIARDRIFSDIDIALVNTESEPLSLPDSYAAWSLPIIEDRLRIAGVRLSRVLNDVLAADSQIRMLQLPDGATSDGELLARFLSGRPCRTDHPLPQGASGPATPHQGAW